MARRIATTGRPSRRSRPGSFPVAVAVAILAATLEFAAATGACANGVFVTPRKTIYPGDAIQDGVLGDLTLARGTDNFGQPLATREQAVGRVARRTLLPGQPIAVNALRAPYAVTSGKIVTIVYSSGELTISARAIAMQNGSIGDIVAVKNADSNAIIRGTVTADGSVEIRE